MTFHIDSAAELEDMAELVRDAGCNPKVCECLCEVNPCACAEWYAEAARRASVAHRLLPALQAENERLREVGLVINQKGIELALENERLRSMVCTTTNADMQLIDKLQARVKELEKELRDIADHSKPPFEGQKWLNYAHEVATQALRADEPAPKEQTAGAKYVAWFNADEQPKGDL